ncbi:MAG: cytochrome c [Nitrospira sp.]|nr:cytochrome c [Nitrospira sp.]
MMISGVLILVGCATHGADDRNRKKPETPKHLPTSSTTQEKKPQSEDGAFRDDGSWLSTQRGKILFNGKALCFECHGQNGDIHTIPNADAGRSDPTPTDLRMPTDKSIRQLYLILKYGIPATDMAPIQDADQLSDADIVDIISYILILQGTRLSPDTISIQRFRRHTETDVVIERMCAEEFIAGSDLDDDCENRYAARYRDLIIGRPPDIPTNRYIQIEARCKRQAKRDLDRLALCYRTEYLALRQLRTERSVLSPGNRVSGPHEHQDPS